MNDREDGPLFAEPEPADADDTQPASPAVTPEDDEDTPARGGCRTRLRGWAGAHLHGAVRPRRRAAGRGRPPGRWC
ncbi:hypothetical protein [Actinoplanes sp. NBRC 103695]|uniref:hypothetical protein n=1 Tax=Actinoplanes sp. NBRC 103695 TaxID=3032202 RepID=UPI0024A2D2E4|nr:hypothetical protein [Actinoplanes sp. NBRC 103695]GLY97694.1 hypothetical protein Acsp02_49480 [Actinoplanes sp. NBRC 103695]